MELKQYAAEHIIENGKHYPEKWVNRYFVEVADAQCALDVLQAQLAECYRLSGADPDGNEDWRLAEHAVAEVKRLREESDKELDCKDTLIEQLQAQLRQVGEERDEYLRRLKETCLAHGVLLMQHHDVKKLVEALPVVKGLELIDGTNLDDIRGDAVLIPLLEKTHAKALFELLRYRATLGAQDAGKGVGNGL